MRDKKLYPDKEELRKLTFKFGKSFKEEIEKFTDSLNQMKTGNKFNSKTKKYFFPKYSCWLKFHIKNKKPTTRKQAESKTLELAGIEKPKNNSNFYLQEQPIYYDKNCLWWFWDKEELRWKLSDEIEILNLIESITGEDIITPKNRTLILNSLKQECRKTKPKDLPEFSICFKNIIYNLKKRKEIPISSEYFITSPIPYNLGKNDKTPIIDELFNQWVGKDYVKTLYEIIAYSVCQKQFLQRWFALTGAGSNGKGTFNNLITKFIGQENCVSSSFKSLISRNFETSALYKKPVCFMGEAESYDLSNTNLIKQLTGEDLIRYEFKGKTPFSEKSPTTFIMNTNSLPKTPDKSDGFYRRVIVIPFPNQFKITPNLLNVVSEEELNNLCRKVVNILLELIKNNQFSNEGSIEDRRRIYESHSSPLMIFIEKEFEEEGNGYYKLREFAKEYNEYRKQQKLRILTIFQIGKELREEGFEISSRKYKNEDNEIIDSAKSVVGITKKTIKNLISKDNLMCKTTQTTSSTVLVQMQNDIKDKGKKKEEIQGIVKNSGLGGNVVPIIKPEDFGK